MKGKTVLFHSLLIFLSAVIMIICLSVVIRHIKPHRHSYHQKQVSAVAACQGMPKEINEQSGQYTMMGNIPDYKTLIRLKPFDLFLLLVFWAFAILFHCSCRKVIDMMQHCIEHCQKNDFSKNKEQSSL